MNPHPPYKRLQNFATLRSHIFISFQQITFKRGNFTNLQALFSVVSTNFRELAHDKSWEKKRKKVYLHRAYLFLPLFRIMSLSGSPIVNHGPAASSPQVLIPLGNGQVRATFLQLSFRFLFNYHFRKMSITKSSFHERGTKGTLRNNDGNRLLLQKKKKTRAISVMHACSRLLMLWPLQLLKLFKETELSL